MFKRIERDRRQVEMDVKPAFTQRETFFLFIPPSSSRINGCRVAEAKESIADAFLRDIGFFATKVKLGWKAIGRFDEPIYTFRILYMHRRRSISNFEFDILMR